MSDTAQDRWDSIAADLRRAKLSGGFDGTDRTGLQDLFLDIAWPHLERHGVSWAGFYLESPEASPEHRLVLGPSRGGPACSPIGLHGACGQAFLARSPLVVRDVTDLGEAYIACDPRDRSEVVVPIRAGNRVIGVLDLDSHQIGAFDEEDARLASELLRLVGLSDGSD